MGTSIKVCTCENKFQDKEYGKQKRVHNSGEKVWRCTVCRSEKPRKDS